MLIRLFLTFAIFSLSTISFGQFSKNLQQLEPPKTFENVHIEKISEDELHSSFVIWVKKSVPEHYHAKHSESIYVLEGEALMTINDDQLIIKTGDHVHIPVGTWHSVIEVRSKEPIKVLSIQTPRFSGKDRVMKSEIEMH